jgi:hypothetical protein
MSRSSSPRVSAPAPPAAVRQTVADGRGVVRSISAAVTTHKRSRGPAAALTVSFPDPSTVRFSSAELFGDSQGPLARTFFSRAFSARGVVQVELDPGRGIADIVFGSPLQPRNPKLAELAGLLSTGPKEPDGAAQLTFPVSTSQSSQSPVRLQRYGQKLSAWIVRHELPGRLRLHHPALYRRRELCHAIEREFMNTFGVDRYATNELTASVRVDYDPKQIQKHQIVELLDSVVHHGADLPLSTCRSARRPWPSRRRASSSFRGSLL